MQPRVLCRWPAWVWVSALLLAAPDQGPGSAWAERLPAAPAAPAGTAAPAAPAAPRSPAEPVRPWLGLSIEKADKGVLVREVMPDSPCATADVHPGDVVLAVGESKMTAPNDLIDAVRRAGVGQRLTLRLRSPQGTERKVSITTGPRPRMSDWQRGALLGKPAPDFSAKVLTGPAFTTLAAVRGEVVLLDFFASWCGPCMRIMPGLSALAQRHGAAGLRVIGVSAEPAELIGKVIREHRPAYTVVMDATEQATRQYRIYAFPTLVVIDRQGTTRLVTSDIAEAEQAVATALAEGRAQGGAGRGGGG